MNILFLTMVEINSIQDRGLYSDLLRKFRDEGHDVTIVTPIERKLKISTNFKQKEGVHILQVKTFNIQKTNIIEKGIGILSIEYQFLHAVKKYLSDKKYDLILYSTPPITLVKVINYVKKRDLAYSYLLLKDIFPQNAIDMKMMKENGVLHKMFLKKERMLYSISDTIGCMSPANVNYVLKHNKDVRSNKIEVNPNTIEPFPLSYSKDEKRDIRQKYQIPTDIKVFVYGGNLGKPQGLDFLLETITATLNEQIFFLIVGNGTEYNNINKWFEEKKPNNAKLLKSLPKNDYDRLLAACDVGLIFLDKKFTIPNFPSRLLSYLEMGMPIIAATDPNSDIGTVIENAQCGYKVLAGNQNEMQEKLDKLMAINDWSVFEERAHRLLFEEYIVEKSYDLIMNKIVDV